MFQLGPNSTHRGTILFTALTTLAAVDAAAATGTTAAGMAIIRVESRMEHPDVRFSFIGALEGTISPGETIEGSGLPTGLHSVAQPAPSPWLTLVDVRCDDQGSAVPSTGSVVMRAANFHIEDGETVTCTFVYDSFEQFIIPDELPDGAGQVSLPREGIWGVSNGVGSMRCTQMIDREIKGEAYNRGTLTVHEAGARIFVDAHDEEREDATVFRVPEIPGRYSGWVSDTHEGYEVIVHGVNQFITDEWLVGYMFGDIVVETISCRLYRPFEMRWEEPLPN